MSKWGDRKINGSEWVVVPKIYPVGLFWDSKKIRRIFTSPVSFFLYIYHSCKEDILDFLKRNEDSICTATGISVALIFVSLLIWLVSTCCRILCYIASHY